MPLFFLLFPVTLPGTAPYLGGANQGAGFTNAFHQPQEVQLRNYYLHGVIKPQALGALASAFAAILLVLTLASGARP
jgi:hypothetical protein